MKQTTTNLELNFFGSENASESGTQVDAPTGQFASQETQKPPQARRRLLMAIKKAKAKVTAKRTSLADRISKMSSAISGSTISDTDLIGVLNGANGMVGVAEFSVALAKVGISISSEKSFRSRLRSFRNSLLPIKDQNGKTLPNCGLTISGEAIVWKLGTHASTGKRRIYYGITK